MINMLYTTETTASPSACQHSELPESDDRCWDKTTDCKKQKGGIPTGKLILWRNGQFHGLTDEFKTKKSYGYMKCSTPK